jgi:hypothetical protein
LHGIIFHMMKLLAFLGRLNHEKKNEMDKKCSLQE